MMRSVIPVGASGPASGASPVLPLLLPVGVVSPAPEHAAIAAESTIPDTRSKARLRRMSTMLPDRDAETLRTVKA